MLRRDCPILQADRRRIRACRRRQAGPRPDEPEMSQRMTPDPRRRRLHHRRRPGGRHARRHPRRRRPAHRGGGCRAAAAHGAAGFRRPRLCHRADLEAPAGRRRHLGPAAGRALPDPRHPGGRWPAGRAAPPRLSLHFDCSRGLGDEPFGWMVEARSLRVALNARLPALPDLQVFAPADGQVERARRRRGGAALDRGGACTRAAGGRRRGPQQPAAPAGRHPRHARSTTTRSAWSAPSRMRSRTTTPRWSSSCRTGPSRSCRWPGRAISAPRPIRMPRAFVWADRTAIAQARCWRWTMPPSGASWRGALGDHLGAHPADRAALVLSAHRRCMGARWTDTAPGAGGRCRAWHAPDRRPGAEPRLPRRRGAGRGGDRRVERRRRIPAAPAVLAPLPGAAAARTRC